MVKNFTFSCFTSGYLLVKDLILLTCCDHTVCTICYDIVIDTQPNRKYRV